MHILNLYSFLLIKLTLIFPSPEHRTCYFQAVPRNMVNKTMHLWSDPLSFIVFSCLRVIYNMNIPAYHSTAPTLLYSRLITAYDA